MDAQVQTALYAALDPLTDAPLWWTVTDDSTLPRAIIQLQSDITTAHRISRAGYTTLITVKAQALSLDQARVVRDALCPPGADGVPSLPALTIAGYAVGAQFVRTPILPFDGRVYQSGHIFRLTISKP